MQISIATSHDEDRCRVYLTDSKHVIYESPQETGTEMTQVKSYTRGFQEYQLASPSNMVTEFVRI